jgi:nucleotide-binding universal stress UspA family protein
MIRFNRILFPVDLSRESRESAPFVAAMAARFSSQLFLLHVLEPRLSYYPIPAAATAGALQHDTEARQARKNEFRSFVSEFFNGMPVRPQVTEGDVANQILSCTQENKVDLIMMPTHGHGLFRRLILGSVTARVLHSATCPVWTGVHTDEMWSKTGSDWHRFQFAVDADQRNVPLLKWAVQFTCEQGAVLQVVHAVDAAVLVGAGEPDPVRDSPFGVAREKLDASQAEAGTKLDIKVALGPVSQVVREAALDHEADLVLIGRGVIQEGLGQIRSSAYEVVRDSPCPVISV